MFAKTIIIIIREDYIIVREDYIIIAREDYIIVREDYYYYYSRRLWGILGGSWEAPGGKRRVGNHLEGSGGTGSPGPPYTIS